MKICKFCEQGEIFEVKTKKTNEIVYLCDECEALWLSDEFKDEEAVALWLFMEERNLSSTWDQFIVIKQI